MGAQEVEIGDKHGDGGNSAHAGTIAICVLVVAFESAVQPFNNLLQRAVFLGNRVLVGEADDLGDVKVDAMPGEEMFCQQVYGVSVSNEVEFVRDFAQLDQNIVDGINSGNVVAVSLDAVRSDDFLGGIKEKEDIVPNAANLDIGFVAAVGTGKLVRVMVDQRLDDRRNGIDIVGNGLVGDFHVMDIVHDGGGFAQ